MTDKLRHIKDMVLFELENRPETRSSDRLLIVRIYEDYFGITKNDLFLDVLLRDDVPNFESIRRCRAKVQEVRPDLKADKEVVEFREDNQQAYFNFFGGGYFNE